MMNHEILERTIMGLKEQVLEIEESYITLDDIKDRFISIDESSRFADSIEVNERFNELTDRDNLLQTQLSDKVPFHILDEYVKKSEYNPSTGGVDEKWVESTIDYKIKNAIASVIDDLQYQIDYSQKDYIKTVTDKIDSMKNIIIESVMSDLEYYIKNDELNDKLQELGYADKATIYTYIQNYVDNKLSSIGGFSKDDLVEFAKKSDIPVRVSQLINDRGYLTEHQSLDGYVKKSELNSYIKITEFNTEIENKISPLYDDFITKVDLKDHTKEQRNWVLDNLVRISSKLDGLKYVQPSELDVYIKKSDIPHFSRLVDVDKLDLILNNYVKKSDIDDSDNSDNLTDLSGYVEKSELLNYVKSKDFENYKSEIESKNYITSSILSAYLSDYAKKSDINPAGVTEDYVKNVVNNSISKIKIPQFISDFPDHKDYLTEHQSLSEYVKKYEIRDFITKNNADIRYLKIDDFVLPDNVVYKSDIKNFVSSDRIDKLELDVVRKSQLDDYVLLSDFNQKTISIENNIKINYVKKSEFEDALADLNNITDKSNYFATIGDLDGYVRRSELSDFITFENYADKKYLMRADMSAYFKMVEDEMSSQKLWVNENYLTRKEAANLTQGGGINVDDVVLSNYYTKEDVHLRFLSKEDYRGIKRAATLNFEYNDYPDLFFSVLNNHHNIKLIDGFYVVDGKSYIVRNNKIVPVADRRSPHWIIETEDVDWRYRDEENLNE